jgi:hypothetical protein
MNNAPQIGRILGVPLRLHWSVPVLVFLFAYSLGGQPFPVWAPGHSQAAYTLVGLTLLLLLSRLAHESAHALTARSKGIPVHDVTLWAVGGMTEMGKPPAPGAAFIVAVIGPLTSLARTDRPRRRAPRPLRRTAARGAARCRERRRHDRPRPPYWADVLAAQLRTGTTVLVVAHGNSLRALAAVLDRLTEPEIERPNIPTGAPLRFDFDAALRPLVRRGTYLAPSRDRKSVV